MVVDGTGEPAAALLRPDNIGSNTADHIDVTRKALVQLPSTISTRPGEKVLVRTDGAGASHTYLTWLHNQRVSYSIGFALTDAMVTDAPEDAWSAAVAAVAAKTESAARRTPFHPTSRCMGSIKTGSGWPSFNSPST